MRDKIEEVLLKVGIPCGNLGFKYITDAMILLDTKEWKNPKWTYLYKKIAEMNGTTAQRVERAIRHSLFVARGCKTNYEVVEHYLGFTYCENGNTLALLYMRIKQEMEGVSNE